ncbi:MAG: hypothetical protein Greene07147_650 [Parcubacteria group bacterium Greene0714_7]|nr:MAG: hypothetical protein Greene07147_650 [Parcubacteria group bacterium Greene0714_7]
MRFLNLIGGERPLHKDHDEMPLAPGVYDKNSQLKARTPEQVDGDDKQDLWDQTEPAGPWSVKWGGKFLKALVQFVKQ